MTCSAAMFRAASTMAASTRHALAGAVAVLQREQQPAQRVEAGVGVADAVGRERVLVRVRRSST